MNSQENPQADYKNWGESHDISMAYWRSVRASIEHENQLVNYRITWLLAFEALLFGALGIFVKEYLEYMKHGSMPPLGLYFIALVGFVNIGIIAAFYVERYMRGAEDAHEALVKWWRDQCKEKFSSSTNPPIAGGNGAIISLTKFDLKPSKESFSYLINKFTRQSRYPLLFVFAWLSFNYTILKYTPFIKHNQVSSLTSIGWFAAVLLPLFILLIWAMVYLFQRQEFKNNLSGGTVSYNLELIICILAWIVTACLMFAIYCSVSFGPWYGLPRWLALLPVIILLTAIGLLAIFDKWIRGTSKNWPWRSLGLHSLKLPQWVSMVSRDGTRIFRGALKLLRRNEYNPDQFDGHQGVSRQRKPSQRRHQK